MTVPVKALTEFVRSTPLLVQLVGAAAVFSSVEPLTIGIVVLGIHYADVHLRGVPGRDRRGAQGSVGGVPGALACRRGGPGRP